MRLFLDIRIFVYMTFSAKHFTQSHWDFLLVVVTLVLFFLYWKTSFNFSKIIFFSWGSSVSSDLSIFIGLFNLNKFILTLSLIAKYFNNDFQKILTTILKVKTLTTTIPSPKSLCKRFLKSRFLEICWDKTYMKYHNFYQ